MPKRAQLLYTLQRIDSRLTLKKKRYQQVQALMGESKALQQARKALKTAEEELSQWRGRLRDHELEVAGVQAKLEGTEGRLYGGKVTNPKELTDESRAIAQPQQVEVEHDGQETVKGETKGCHGQDDQPRIPVDHSQLLQIGGSHSTASLPSSSGPAGASFGSRTS